MSDLVDAVRTCVAETRFSGAIRVEEDGAASFEDAFGLADRRSGETNTVSTRFGVASATKGLTALTVMALAADGTLALSTPARDLLGDDLPMIDGRVTLEMLLSHRSGIGDYLDEDAGHAIDDYVMPFPVHRFATTEGYVPALTGRPQVFEPGSRFAYNNSGYVVLALLAERATGRSFPDLVEDRVLGPAGMSATAFLRSDELPSDAAIGYLAVDGPRTNALHLPVRGSGDGGAYSTLADVSALWHAVRVGAVVPPDLVDAMTARVTLDAGQSRAYGLGFWLSPEQDWWQLEGYDAGVSFMSRRDPSTSLTWTVISNTSEGAWPIARLLSELFSA